MTNHLTTDIDDESRLRYVQARMAAIEAIRAIAEPALKRYEDAWNGYDAANDVELVDHTSNPPVVDEAAIARIQAEITADLAKSGITLMYDMEAEIPANWAYMANSDGSGTDHRLVCRPAAIWTSEAYGEICVIEAITYDAG